jgi:hypothetical protein
MRAVGIHRGARTISLALVAGLVAFEAVLVFGTGAVGIPGVFLVRFAEGSGDAQAPRGAEAIDGGESSVAKLPEAASTPAAPPLAETVEHAPAVTGEPRLAGLADPADTEWDGEHSKPTVPKAFGADSKTREVLPWDAVEPVPLTSTASPASGASAALAAAAPPEAAPSPLPVNLPASGDVEAWVKAKATEVKGEDRGRPLYHFEVWLEPPEEVKSRLVAVAYDFNTPAVRPQSQVSSEQKTGFRVSVGGLACADKITVTLKFDDGRSQQVAIDGCRLLGRA